MKKIFFLNKKITKTNNYSKNKYFNVKQEPVKQGTIKTFANEKKRSQKNFVAQGTIEYLIIVGVVVVISLVVVGLVVNQTSNYSDSPQKTTNLAWKTKEIQVKELIIDEKGNGFLLLASNINEDTQIELVIINEEGNEVNEKLVFLEDKIIQLTGLEACNQNNQEYTIKLTYLTKEGLHKKIEGTYYVNCFEGIKENSIMLGEKDTESMENISITDGYFSLNNFEAGSTSERDNFLEGENKEEKLVIEENQITLGVNN